MRSLLFCSLAVILQPVLSAPCSRNYDNGTSYSKLLPGSLLGRDVGDDFDENDHSGIVRMAAIGDSYSAGIGAGSRLGGLTDVEAYRCSRCDHSYPWLVHNDPDLGDPANRNFQFKSCSGALATEVLSKQIPTISGDQQVILLSAGGNDIGLTKILNQCVYQWFSITSQQAITFKLADIWNDGLKFLKLFDFDAASKGCDGQLDDSEKLANGKEFGQTLDFLLSSAKAKLGTGGMVYWTGYAKFFAESYGPQCDTVSWAVWFHALTTAGGFPSPSYLLSARRRRMNDLVDVVNNQIKAAIQRTGSGATFVDYDYYVGEVGGRFCESGVDEAASGSGRRAGLMFYEFSSLDPIGLSPYKRSEDQITEGTFEGDLGAYALLNLALDPDAKYTQEQQISSSKEYAAESIVDDVGDVLTHLNPLPDGYGRTFHPQIILHQLIANNIIYHMTNQRALDNGLPAIAEVQTFDNSCPLIPIITGKSQQIALASYIHPLADPDAWDRMIAFPSSKVSVLVANVINGPGAVVDKDWEGVINRAFASGKRIIGYVRTGYLGVSWQKFQTRLGSHELADWAAQIQIDVELWYTMYPGKISGIFFDEGWNECGENNQYAELYRLITENTKRRHPGAFTALNPGAPMPQCFEHSADTLLTFESSYEDYTSYSFTPNNWKASDYRKIWHIIFNVPADKVEEVAQLAYSRGAGLLDISGDKLPNPYDTLPDDAYMQTLMNKISGGAVAPTNPLDWPNDGSVATKPTGLKVSSFDYSSVTLSWNANPTQPLAYIIYKGGKEIVRLQGSMTKASICNLDPGMSGLVFTVSSIGGDGTESSSSDKVTSGTQDLPGGSTVTNVQVSSTATTSTFKADVLVPYAFLRVYITDPDLKCSMPGWALGYNSGNRVCAHYMVEAETLYTYSGPLQSDPTANLPWSWAQQGEWANVAVTRNVYSYTWTLPIGTSTIDTSYFAIQAEGYGPLTSVYSPCPDHWNQFSPKTGASCVGSVPYDCKGEGLCSTVNVKYCDKAANNMNRGDRIYTSNGDYLAASGNCWANNAGYGCKIYVQGTDENGNNCKITGDDMWNAYQDIRDVGSCKKCGTKHFGNGCMVSVDYMSECDNRDGTLDKVYAIMASNVTTSENDTTEIAV